MRKLGTKRHKRKLDTKRGGPIYYEDEESIVNNYFISQKLPINAYQADQDDEKITFEYLLRVIQEGIYYEEDHNRYLRYNQQRCIVGYDTNYYDRTTFDRYYDPNHPPQPTMIIPDNEKSDMTIYLTVAEDEKTIIKNSKTDISVNPSPLTEEDLTHYIFYVQSVPCKKENEGKPHVG